jgi:hypothetical protein
VQNIVEHRRHRDLPGCEERGPPDIGRRGRGVLDLAQSERGPSADERFVVGKERDQKGNIGDLSDPADRERRPGPDLGRWVAKECVQLGP